MQISIVITHYRKPEFLLPLLNYLIDSIPIDISNNIEIIVVDNLSDRTAEVEILADKYFQSRVIQPKFIFLDRNYGPSYARNRGVEISTGDYIQFLDEDDWIDVSKLTTQYKLAVSMGYPSFIASQWARVSFDSTWDSCTLQSSHFPSFQEPVLLSVIKSDGFVPLMAGLIKRGSFLAAGGLREEMWLVEDVRLLIDLYQADPKFAVAPSDVPLFFYRCGQPNSLSVGSDRVVFYDACYSNAIYVEQLLQEKQGDLSVEELKVLLELYGQLARFYFEHDRHKFHEMITKIRTLDPNYLPADPPHLRWLSRWIGYENAEGIALVYRRINRKIRK